MTCLALPGSFRADSSNGKLLQYLQRTYPAANLDITFAAKDLPLFNSLLDASFTNDYLDQLKNQINKADAILICTPEYLHGIPAVLKNMFEWCHQWDALAGKRIVPLCYTPSAPRGEKAMQTLLWTLEALSASVPGNLIIHHTDISFNSYGELIKNENPELLDTLFELLVP